MEKRIAAAAAAAAAAIAAAPLLVVAVVVAVGIFSTTTITTIQSAQAFIDPTTELREPKAPMAVSQDGNNVYVVWWTNR
jgi:hypothetical protein